MQGVLWEPCALAYQEKKEPLITLKIHLQLIKLALIIAIWSERQGEAAAPLGILKLSFGKKRWMYKVWNLRISFTTLAPSPFPQVLKQGHSWGKMKQGKRVPIINSSLAVGMACGGQWQPTTRERIPKAALTCTGDQALFRRSGKYRPNTLF